MNFVSSHGIPFPETHCQDLLHCTTSPEKMLSSALGNARCSGFLPTPAHPLTRAIWDVNIIMSCLKFPFAVAKQCLVVFEAQFFCCMKPRERCNSSLGLVLISFSGVPRVIAACNVCNRFGQIKNGWLVQQLDQ